MNLTLRQIDLLSTILLALVHVLGVIIGSSFEESSHANTLSDNEGLNEINQKIEQYLEEANADDSDNSYESDLRFALLKRALPRMGKRYFWDDYDIYNSEESDFDKRALPRMGRALPRMGRALPRMGRALPRMGRALPRMGRTLPRMG